jgi:hypothetical protein
MVQVAIVLALWDKRAQFPVRFARLEGFTDETKNYIDTKMNNNTPLVHDIF